MTHIIVKRYEHFNRALDKHITSKAHYEKEMAKQGMVPYEVGKRLADEYTKKNTKLFDRPSPKAEALIRGIGQKRKDNKGKIKLSDREVDAMKGLGVSFNPSFIPQGTKGGFE